MKKRCPNPRKTKSFSVTVPHALVPQIDGQAAREGRSRSSYISWLIAKDIEAQELKLRTVHPNVME